MFKPEQKHKLLTMMGYKGPVNEKIMDQYMNSNPAVSAKMGRFDRAMKRGFAQGGDVSQDPLMQQLNSLRPQLEQESKAEMLKIAKSLGFNSVEEFNNATPEQQKAFNDQFNQYRQSSPAHQKARTLSQELSKKYPPAPQAPAGTSPDGSRFSAKSLLKRASSSSNEDYTKNNQDPNQAEVIKAYQEVFGREPKQDALDFYSGHMAKGNLDANSLRENLKSSSEYTIRQGYQNVLGRSPDQGGLDYYRQQMDSGALTPETFMETLYNSPEFKIPDANAARDMLSAANDELTKAKASGNQQRIDAAQKEVDRAQGFVDRNIQKINEQTPSTKETVVTGLTDPTSMTTPVETAKVQTDPSQFVAEGTGQVAGEVPEIQTTAIADQVKGVEAPTKGEVSTIDPTKSADAVKEVTSGFEAVKGVVSPDALVKEAQGELSDTSKATAAQGTLSDTSKVTAAEGELSEGAMADAAQFDSEYIQQVEAGGLEVTPEQLVEAQGQDEIAPASKIAQSTGIDPAVAIQGTVSQNELPKPAQIAESDMAQARAIASGGQLNADAVAVAARLDSFSVDDGTLAEFVQGSVKAQDTVQYQLTQLMKQFDDGTPAWAAGAVRAANAAMASRGLGGSSMAGAAILQATMESALPIAAQDAQTFANMNLTNVNNKQKVALANAAAQQGLALANLNNEQQVALQNSNNAFRLQVEDLSNQQAVVIANAQIKAALQGQNLSNQQQANIATAARYAEMANINLNNAQQTALQNNANNLNIELANLSNKQQSYIANAQLEAALQNKQIDNRQQAAIQNAARFAEVANLEFSAKEKAAIHNSSLLASIGEAELNAKNAAILQNAATLASMDMANLRNRQEANVANAAASAQMDITNVKNLNDVSLANAAASVQMDLTNVNNRQQARIANAKAFLDMDLTNINNVNRAEIFKTQAQIDSILNDTAAENAAKQFNATSENQATQFYDKLVTDVKMFAAEQYNTALAIDAGEENAAARLRATMEEQRNQFNASNALVIAQANAQWRQNIALADTEAQNLANMENAKYANNLTSKALDQIWMREKDLMDYAYRSSESRLDRDLSILLADKNLKAVREEIDAANDREAGAGWAAVAYDAVKNIFDW